MQIKSETKLPNTVITIRLNTAKEISAILKNSQNRMYLNSDSLLMDILSSNNDMKYEKR